MFNFVRILSLVQLCRVTETILWHFLCFVVDKILIFWAEYQSKLIGDNRKIYIWKCFFLLSVFSSLPPFPLLFDQFLFLLDTARRFAVVRALKFSNVYLHIHNTDDDAGDDEEKDVEGNPNLK
jgi:hypothetical protein